MGTRSKTVFIDNDGKPLVTMYRQMDGYYSGHGKELADFLKGKKLVNGIPYGGDTTKLFNGMGCLAAQVIAEFKDGIGGIYIVQNNNTPEEFVYEVSGKIGDEPNIKVNDFNGSASEFDDFLKKQEI